MMLAEAVRHVYPLLACVGNPRQPCGFVSDSVEPGHLDVAWDDHDAH